MFIQSNQTESIRWDIHFFVVRRARICNETHDQSLLLSIPICIHYCKPTFRSRIWRGSPHAVESQVTFCATYRISYLSLVRVHLDRYRYISISIYIYIYYIYTLIHSRMHCMHAYAYSWSIWCMMIWWSMFFQSHN